MYTDNIIMFWFIQFGSKLWAICVSKRVPRVVYPFLNTFCMCLIKSGCFLIVIAGTYVPIHKYQ